MLSGEVVAKLFHELSTNNVLIQDGVRSIRYAQDEYFGLAITDDNLIALIDIQKKLNYFTIEIIDQNQSIVDLVLRAWGNCAPRDFFKYRNDTVIFYPNK
jgi:hypothetical protein